MEPINRSANGFCQGDLGAVYFCSIPIPFTRRTKIDPHPADELDEFLVLFRSPKSPSGFPAPEHLDSSSLPADEGFGLEDDQRISPIGAKPHEQQPKTSVGSPEPGPTGLPFEHYELMAQRQDFEGEIMPTSEERKRVTQNEPENGQHTQQ